jgi:hypothetical protein
MIRMPGYAAHVETGAAVDVTNKMGVVWELDHSLKL